MDAKLNELAQNFRRFKAAFIPNDFNISANLLSDLKVMLIEFSSLPPLYQDTPNAAKELEIVRDIYEHAVLLSMKTEDQDAFERDFFQLKHYINVRAKRQAHLVLVTMGKCPCVLDPASEPTLMDTRVDLAISSKKGALVISSMKRKHIRYVVPIMAAPPLPVMTACEANSPLGLTRVKHQARLVLVTVGKHPRVLDPASELDLMDIELDLAFSSKEGALVISPMKHKHRRLVGSKN
ncbi:hypothetical protein M0R45_035814 [Rubus argutus]|uniref:Uncharacterized protein n=1 Tax=Rubus argutus TaxID=59490 RepID=A0AAW1VU82_RUBAR